MSEFVCGQRWLSTAEPELGLGRIEGVEFRMVRVFFPATDETRTYAADGAPLQRYVFRVGDTIGDGETDGKVVEVEEEEQGTVSYRLDCGGLIAESAVFADAGMHGPEDRMRSGQFDENSAFELRSEAWRRRRALREHRAWGLSGARMSLIPHQLHIASRVLSRPTSRVLLADEVGLGKTIEAGLIIHSMLLTGRAERVLILVPNSLVHQWFVEMLRRFNLRFSIVDEDRYADSDDDDPFLDRQLVLCTQQMLGKSADRQRQALDADWDMVVVDEAHHIGWQVGKPSPEYRMLDVLAKKTPSMVLLTATPDQLGLESHFGRLQLLDPDRFDSFEDFLADQSGFQKLVGAADRVLDEHPLSEQDCSVLHAALGESAGLVVGAVLSATEREAILERLIDRHGTGRVVFRNTRSVISGFPKRKLHPVPLPIPDGASVMVREQASLGADAVLSPPDAWARPSDVLADDPRVPWLIELLKRRPDTKFLLITARMETVIALDEVIKKDLAVKTARFHEDLSLVQRDRNAAWFAEPDGARLLMCSEIGSEGRNFQFVQHLVLFDLPSDPELLEQRIGRLDRIGQKGDVHLHVPFWVGTGQETLFRWYDAAGAFVEPLRGGHLLLEALADQVAETALAVHAGEDADIEDGALEKTTVRVAGEIRKQLEAGRDRLLEYNSYRESEAAALVTVVGELDDAIERQRFMESVFETFGVRCEELSYHCSLLQPTASLLTDAFPAIPEDGLKVAWDRNRATAREDAAFLSWEHPIVTGAIDLLTSGEHGNCACALWPADQGRLLLLETLWIVEPVAPGALHADQFFPAAPIRIVVDHAGNDRSDAVPAEKLAPKLTQPRDYQFFKKAEIQQELLPKMLEGARGIAESASSTLRDAAIRSMQDQLGAEVLRLRELATDHSGPAGKDADALEIRQEALARALNAAPMRLDAIRLIWRAPVE